MLSNVRLLLFSPAASGKRRIVVAYSVFLALSSVVYFFVAEREFASIQTMAALSQCLAIALLGMQVHCGSMEGISMNSLTLHAAALMCRLSSTTWLNGYLPVDASGDGIYQVCDVLGLMLSMRILAAGMSCKSPRRPDVFGVGVVLCITFVLATILHANMDKRPLFDTLWMMSIFLASVAIVPQVLALRASPGKADMPAGHALSAMTMAQVLSGIYMWYARRDMTCDPWLEGFNHSVWAVLAAHALPLLVACDFSEDSSGVA
jgi:uncharacterized membrane protein (DUF485 family)